MEIKDIKTKFPIHFKIEMEKGNSMSLIYEIFEYGTAYVVGGFFRDFLENKISRDIDIIVDIDNEKLINIITNNNFNYNINRYGGIKISTKYIDIDIWSIENNWAFKNNLVKLNENDNLNSIAKGCFYNYDALVINLNNFSFNIRYYNDFINSKELKILSKMPKYKNLNPSIEANILRAFHLKKQFKITYEKSTYDYLYDKINSLNYSYSSALERLEQIKIVYPKYQILNTEEISNFIFEIQDNNSNQLKLDLF